MTDLLVAGGGPVGLATAIEASRAGLRVTVVEPRRDPVDKACGEGLMPAAVAALARLGVHPAGERLAGIRYLDGTSSAQARFRSGPGRGVRRPVLQATLADRAESLGVVRRPGRVERICQDADGVDVDGLRTRWLVVADGLHSPLRSRLGLDAPRRGPVRYGLRRHYRIAAWTDFVEVHWGPAAEAYVTPVGPDLVGVAVLCAGGRPYDDWLAGFPALSRRLAGAEPVTKVRGAGPLHRAARSRVQGRVLLVGDAAGYVDALTGEGIAVGLAAAEALVACLLAGRPQDYDARWRQVSRRYRALTTSLLWAGRRSWTRERIVPVAASLPGAFSAGVHALSGG